MWFRHTACLSLDLGIALYGSSNMQGPPVNHPTNPGQPLNKTIRHWEDEGSTSLREQNNPHWGHTNWVKSIVPPHATLACGGTAYVIERVLSQWRLHVNLIKSATIHQLNQEYCLVVQLNRVHHHSPSNKTTRHWEEWTSPSLRRRC